MPSTHTADFQTAALKATDLEAVEKINVGLETELARKQLNIIADAPEIRIQDKTGSASETTMSIVADGGATHFRAGIDTFAEGTETKGNVKFQSSTGATTHAEIVGSSGKLELQDGGLGLKLGSNVSVTGTSSVIQEITGPHARDVVPLRKYPEVAFAEGKFDTTDNEIVSTYWAGHSTVFQGGYSVKTSHHSTDDGGQYGWHVFDDNPETIWKNAEDYNSSTGNYDYGFTNVQSRLTDTNSTNHDGDHVIMGSPSKLKIVKVSVTCKSSIRRVVNYSVLGSNSTGTTGWTLLDSGSFAAQDANIATITSPTTHFKYHAFVVRSVTAGVNGQRFQINSIHYYGYDEDVGAGDDSVDVTFKSVYNSPDLTNAALYIDGDKGSTPTDFSGEGHALTDNSESFSGNAWSFTSLSTSNVTMSTGDFAMEGTHPHAVSMWFNAANVSSNATLFHVGTAAGEGDAKTSISLTESGHLGWIDGGDNQFLSANTWHNLVYATQGGGGVRTCYLDGRKLGDVSVQDTFGEYPPFAMTTYSEYGYTVSASSELNTTYVAWKAYDNTTGLTESWISGDRYNSDGTPKANSFITIVDGIDEPGEYLQLELPHNMHLSSLGINGIRSSDANRYPRDAIVCASIDGIIWTSIGSWTGEVNRAESDIKHYILDSTKSFKYIRVIVSKVQTSNDTYAMLSNLSFFGHKENDTTRFPVSSTMLKYPHVAMTGQPGTSQSVSDLQHAQRGYEVTASSMYVGNASNPYQPWRMFDDIGSSSWWASTGQANTYGGGSGAYGTVRSANLGSDSGGSATPENGEWVKIKLQHAIVLSHIVMVGTTDTSALPKSFKLYGSNNGTSWTEILAVTGASSLNTSTGTTFTPSSTPSAYKHFGLVITQTQGRTNYTVVGELKLYGTEEDLDVIARVGEGLDGKVANFRVYDKYLHEEQALELWDAQKDQFGRAESSVVVHKGRLGVGTTEPEGRFAVLDEAGEMGEFPPRAMTAEETYMEGHGVFKATSSAIYNSTYPPYKAFDKEIPYNTSTNQWVSQGGSYDNASPQSFPVTSGDKAVLFEGTYGSWIQLQMPYKIFLKKMVSFIRLNRDHEHATSGIIYGSNDGGNTYERVYTFNDVPVSDLLYQGVHHEINPTKAYSTYTFQITKLEGQRSFTPIGELKFFGTRERGQSTLHDGSLTLTKNLTVPRIGPALDADDTPRRDRLVVEYNTSTNPTANGTVKDTSGRGLDGLTYNGASYDASEKALVFDGSNDYVTTTLRNISGDFIFSASLWVYHENTTNNQAQFFTIGSNATNQMIGFRLNNSMTSVYVYFYSGNTLTQTISTVLYNWNHFVVTYNGSTQSLYQNGVLLGTNAGSGLNLPENPELRIGNRNTGGSNEYLDGYLSNFKLYDVVLTADEAKRLYDMGRCDEGHHVVNFSKTRVGIGLGDGEAPQAALDVRDLCEIKQLGVGMIGTGIHRPSIAPLSVCKDTFDELGGGIELMRTNTPEGNSGLGFNRGSAIWHAYKSSTNRETLYFAIGGGNYGTSSYDYNRVRGYIDTNNGGGNITFTGQHRAVVEGTPLHETEKYQGLIVSAKNNKYVKLNNGIETGSSAITINESVPLVSLSSVAQDKSCFGVISDSEDPDVREDRIGNFVTTGQKEKGDHRWFINSVGEGAIWVTDMNGVLESGDYITTSNIAGYGQKQDGAGLMNYTVAKITMDCDFQPATQPIQCIKQSNVVETHYTGLVQVAKSVPHEFVTTVVSADDAWSNVSISPSDVTYAEWSNLESNVQNTYTLQYTSTSNVVYDVKYTKTTTANVTAEDAWDAVHIEPSMVTYAEYSNLEANVQNTYTLTYTMTTKVEATEAIYSNLSTGDKTLFIPTYYQMVEQTVDAEYPGAVKHETVTDRLENALDEHGQLQWEDEPSGATEKAYKIRYLDASGQQTDEANCVHRAAFVGCTYHCG